MKFGPHHVAKGGFYSLHHPVEGVDCHVILHDPKPWSAEQRAKAIAADLDAGAARRAAGESVPAVEPRQVIPYGPAGHAEHADGVWFGEALIGGVGYLMTAPGTTYAEGKAALTLLFSDLAAGETLGLSERMLARHRANPTNATIVELPVPEPGSVAVHR